MVAKQIHYSAELNNFLYSALAGTEAAKKAVYKWPGRKTTKIFVHHNFIREKGPCLRGTGSLASGCSVPAVLAVQHCGFPKILPVGKSTLASN